MQQFVVPADATSHFHLRNGDKVADFGAGSGHFAREMAKEVGPSGRVYAVEIQKGLAERLADTMRREHVANVEVLWADLEHPRSIKLPDGVLDAALLSNTLFQIKDKDAALDEMGRLVRRGGKFLVMEWSDSYGGLGPHPNDVMKENATKELFARHGFVLEQSFPAGAHHYGLGFRKN